MFNKSVFLCLALASLFFSCISQKEPGNLPFLGERTVNAKGDTLYHQVPDFSFVDQDSQVVNNATFKDKIYVVDFFFIHCPTICPKVTANCLRIYNKFKSDARVGMLAHTVDTKNDTIAALKRHAGKIGVTDNKMWHFVTGEKDLIYGIADDYYLVIPSEDKDTPGGFNHDGRLILVDKDRHIRSYCDGTDAASVDKFMVDIERLLKEQYK